MLYLKKCCTFAKFFAKKTIEHGKSEQTSIENIKIWALLWAKYFKIYYDYIIYYQKFLLSRSENHVLDILMVRATPIFI